MSEWKTYKLGELPIQFIDGDRGKNYPKGDDFSKVGHCLFLNAGNVTKNGWDFSENVYISEEKDNLLRNGKLERGDIVLTTRGTVGNVVLYTDDIPYKHIRINSGMVIIRNNNTCYNPYLYQYLRSYLFLGQVQQFQSGSAQPQIPISTLKKLTISLPPLAEQKRIADILSAIDDKIELNHRINTNLEQQAQALYKSWFVDFEPFGGKMPEDWREGTLGEIMTITSGKHPKNRVSIKTKDVNIPIVGAADIIGYTNEMLYSTPILIIGRVGTHGIVQRLSTKCWPSDNTLVIQTKYYEMCYQLLKQIDYKKLNRGSTQPLITQTDIKGVEIIIPPIEILEEYENRVSILFHSINNYDIENSTLSALRDTLLAKLMSGEIDV